MTPQAIVQIREADTLLDVPKQYLVQLHGKAPEEATWVQADVFHTYPQRNLVDKVNVREDSNVMHEKVELPNEGNELLTNDQTEVATTNHLVDPQAQSVTELGIGKRFKTKSVRLKDFMVELSSNVTVHITTSKHNNLFLIHPKSKKIYKQAVEL